MRIHVSSNNNFISIYFYKINLIKIQQLFKYVNIDHVSILLYESNKYIFDNYILVDDFIPNLDYWSHKGGISVKFSDSGKECDYVTITDLMDLTKVNFKMRYKVKE